MNFETFNSTSQNRLHFHPVTIRCCVLGNGAYSNALIQYEKDLSEHPHNMGSVGRKRITFEFR